MDPDGGSYRGENPEQMDLDFLEEEWEAVLMEP